MMLGGVKPGGRNCESEFGMYLESLFRYPGIHGKGGYQPPFVDDEYGAGPK
jgi:hypothetical protein